MAPETHTDSLKDEDIKVRASAIIAMGKTGDRDAIEYLIQTLENKDEVEWLRGCAAIALGRLSGEEVISSLLNTLQDDKTNVLRAVISALGDAGCVSAIPHLRDILEDASKEEIHPLTITVLGLIGGHDITPTLVQKLGSSNNRVRVRAAMALRELRTEKAVRPFIKLMKDGDECLRGIAASSLGLTGDKQAVKVLIKALEDNAETVRGIAASSLGCLGDGRAVPPLEKALDDESNAVRKQATAALSKLKRGRN